MEVSKRTNAREPVASFVVGTADHQWQFHTQDKIGCGSFGSIYLGKSLKTGEAVAVKVEPTFVKFPQLAYEAKLYQVYQGRTGIPTVFHFGKEHGKNTMVMQLCGKSLEDLFQACGCKFSLKTVLKIADEVLLRLKLLHSKGFLHRDIKPDNFLVAAPDSDTPDTIYVIDFGLAKRFFDHKTRRHRPLRKGKQLTGTARYASINTHVGLEQSRRDDLESLGYVLVYFLQGKLPWQGLVGRNTAPITKEEKYAMIFSSKVSTDVDTLCEGLPTQFADYLRYCRSLGYEEDYASLQEQFKQLARSSACEWDGVYDWTNRVSLCTHRAATTTSTATAAPSTTAMGEIAAVVPATPSDEGVAVRVDSRIATPTNFVRTAK